VKAAKRLGILATHPIQYHAPLFRELARREGVDLTVYFCHRPTPVEQGRGFGVAFEWDVDLLSGYRHVFLENRARKPAKGFFGYDNPDLAEIIAREKFDFFIVHGWVWKSCWQAFWACWNTSTRLGVRSDSQLPHEHASLVQRLKSIIKTYMYPLFVKRFDVCLPYGQRSYEYFHHFGGKNIVIAPHFVDNDWFASKAAELRRQRTALRRQWQIPEDAICFLYCGKFQPIKRPLDILYAMQSLLDKNGCQTKRKDSSDTQATPAVHCLMVGDGGLRSECEQFAQTQGLPVSFAGFLNQGSIPCAYAVSDCLLLPSLSETWGLVVNEAMACALPVIISESCGCAPDLVINGVNGYTYPQGNIAELSKLMRMLVNDRDKLVVLGKMSVKHIESFTLVEAANKLIDGMN